MRKCLSRPYWGLFAGSVERIGRKEDGEPGFSNDDAAVEHIRGCAACQADLVVLLLPKQLSPEERTYEVEVGAIAPLTWRPQIRARDAVQACTLAKRQAADLHPTWREITVRACTPLGDDKC